MMSGQLGQLWYYHGMAEDRICLVTHSGRNSRSHAMTWWSPMHPWHGRKHGVFPVHEDELRAHELGMSNDRWTKLSC